MDSAKQTGGKNFIDRETTETKGVQDTASEISSAQEEIGSKDAYGENFHTHLLEQYKVYVEMADRISSRRLQVSGFYVSLLSALLALLTLTNNKELFDGSQQIVLLLISLLGILLCFLWDLNINSYKQLNSLKFRVIHEMEKSLPFPCYRREWDILKDSKNGKSYFRSSTVERYVPLLFSIPYILLAGYSLFKLVQL